MTFTAGAMTVVAAGTVVGALISGKLGDRYGPGRVLSIALCVFGVGLSVGTFSTSVPVLAVAFPFIALAGGAAVALPYALLLELTPTEEARHRRGPVRREQRRRHPARPDAHRRSPSISCARIFPASHGYAAMWPVLSLSVVGSTIILWRRGQSQGRPRERRSLTARGAHSAGAADRCETGARRGKIHFLVTRSPRMPRPGPDDRAHEHVRREVRPEVDARDRHTKRGKGVGDGRRGAASTSAGRARRSTGSTRGRRRRRRRAARGRWETTHPSRVSEERVNVGDMQTQGRSRAKNSLMPPVGQRAGAERDGDGHRIAPALQPREQRGDDVHHRALADHGGADHEIGQPHRPVRAVEGVQERRDRAGGRRAWVSERPCSHFQCQP